MCGGLTLSFSLKSLSFSPWPETGTAARPMTRRSDTATLAKRFIGISWGRRQVGWLAAAVARAGRSGGFGAGGVSASLLPVSLAGRAAKREGNLPESDVILDIAGMLLLRGADLVA